MLARCIAMLCAVASVAAAEGWANRTPKLHWQNELLTSQAAAILLAPLCREGVEREPFGTDFTCKDRPAAPVSEGAPKSFRVDGFTPPLDLGNQNEIDFRPVRSVIYGHFLSAASEDAALSDEQGSHADFNGGTLLLTKKNGSWQPVWHKRGVISRYCRTLALVSGRDILVCEFEDGGMGHSYHFLYKLDLTDPKDPAHAALLVADSYLLMCEDFQNQSIEAVDIEPGSIDIRLRSGRRRLLAREKEDCGQTRTLNPPRDRDYRVKFLVVGDDVKPDPASTNALTLFRLH